MTSILVYVETQDDQPKKASLEAIGAAKSLGAEVTALVYGPGASSANLAGSGADKALVAEDAAGNFSAVSVRAV